MLRSGVTFVYLAHRRSQDVLTAFQARPMIVSLRTQRRLISATDAHFLVTELARLPETRWPAAPALRERMVTGLARGWPITLTGDEEPTLLRAVAGARTRRPLTASLRLLRDALTPGSVG
jgi:hypothetical protein